MILKKAKKGEGGANWHLIGAVLAILVFVVIAVILVPRFLAARETENCVGECKTFCGRGEIQIIGPCYKDGEVQEGRVCCVGDKKDDEDEDEITIPDTEGDTDQDANGEEDVGDEEAENEEAETTLSLSLGEGLPFPTSMRVDTTFRLNIKTQGQIPESCKIRFLNAVTGEKIDEGDYTSISSEGHCDQEIIITPTQEDVEKLGGNIIFQVVLDGNLFHQQSMGLTLS